MGRKRGTGAVETEFDSNPVSEDNDIASDNSDDDADADSKPRRLARNHTADLEERPNRPLSRGVSNYSNERDKFDGLDAWASSAITMIHFKIIFMFFDITFIIRFKFNISVSFLGLPLDSLFEEVASRDPLFLFISFCGETLLLLLSVHVLFLTEDKL